MKRRLRWAVVPAIGLLLLLLAFHQLPRPIAADQLVDIRWVAAFGLERAALYVPVSIGGRHGYVQLDTGANTALIRAALDRYGVPYKLGEPLEWGGLAGAHRATVSNFRLGPVEIDRMGVLVYDPPEPPPGGGASTPELVHFGTLGRDFFGQGTLYLDFVADKVGVLPRRPRIAGAAIPFADVAAARPVLALRVGSIELNALLDTGTSAFPLVVAPSDVAAVAGTADPPAAAGQLTVSSWGRPVVMTRYEGEFTLQFAGFELTVGEFYASPLQDELRRGTAGQITAIIGNAAFRGMRLALDFGARELVIGQND